MTSILRPPDKARRQPKFRSEKARFSQQKQNAPVRKPGPMRLGKYSNTVAAGLFSNAGLAENSQSRYRIWLAQNASSRGSDLFSVANSSFEMPPTCSTVLTCF